MQESTTPSSQASGIISTRLWPIDLNTLERSKTHDILVMPAQFEISELCTSSGDADINKFTESGHSEEIQRLTGQRWQSPQRKMDGVNLELLSNLTDRPQASNGIQSNLRLETRIKSSSCPRHH